jgi:membrane-bound metal-dependent hydrolase YbcI (DUF457 family)
MDTVTHGIAGLLIGKSFFSERWGPAATVAATVGSVFPDSDVVTEIFSRSPVSLLKYHRGITHSFVAMPFFAVALGALVWWLAKRRGIQAAFWPLVLATLAGIASHIFLDGLTSYGTRMWEPISWVRVSWDWLFIIDPMLTALLLVPQVAAWVQRDKRKAPWRALAMWGLFSVLAALIWGAEWAVGAPINFRVVPIAAVVLAAVFFVPVYGGRFFEWTRREWCIAGLVMSVLYIGLCGVEHHRALERVRAFAQKQPLRVESVAAIPMPPSPVEWNGLVLTPGGVYGTRFNVDRNPVPRFRFLRDSHMNPYIEKAFQLPAVKTYLGFARFPIVRFHRAGKDDVVEFLDIRFYNYEQREGRHPFVYRVVFARDGKVLHQGWRMR